MKPSKEHPELFAYFEDVPDDFPCWFGPDGGDVDKEDWTRIWIISLHNGEYPYHSAEMNRIVWKFALENI